MPELKTSSGGLTIDMKRNRFRILADTLQGLGNPEYIQFLVNPEELYIAVLGSDKPLLGGTANKVRIGKSHPRGSVEFYSSVLLTAIVRLYGSLDYQYSYRLTGDIDTENRIAYFSLKSVQKLERRSSGGREGISAI